MGDYPKPAVTVDVVLFTVMDAKLNVLLIRRGRDPFAGQWALPGGFVDMGESLDSAAMRELEEETGIRNVYLEQLYTFGAPNRDPRDRVITVAYYALVDPTQIKPKLTAQGEAEQIEEVRWVQMGDMPRLAFDHDEIVRYAIKRLRYKLEYTAVGFELLPETFTLTELQQLYEVILGEKLDKRNFRRKVIAMDAVEATKQVRGGSHRPAKLYRFKRVRPRSTFKRVTFER